jgi:hypothetical protein
MHSSRTAHLNLLHHLVRPTRGGAAGVLLVFAFLLVLAAKAGWVGIPLGLLVISWFFKYAYVLFDHTVRGFDEPPTLDIQMMNPISEQRPLAQVAILGLIGYAVYLTQEHVGAAAAAGLAIVCVFFLPASIAILGLESNILKAANPVYWFSLVRDLRLSYGAVLLVVLGYGLGLRLLWALDVWLPVEIGIGMFAVLSVFSFLGGVLYERRHELNLETWVSPERSAALETRQTLRDSDRHLHEAYGLMRAGAHIKSFRMLEEWLQSRGNTPEDYRWLCERTASWDDPRYVTRLTEELIARLLLLKRTGEALDLVGQRLNLDPAFRPKSAADTLSIAQLAARGGGAPRVARILLSDFAARFAGDSHLAAAQALKDHVGPLAP